MSKIPSKGRRGKAALVAVGAVLVALFIWQTAGILSSRPQITRAPPPPPEASFGIDRTNVPAPPIDLPALDGSRFSLAAAKGQLVFVNFWATWCPPCVEEMPSMLRLGQELEAHHPGRFRMVAVSADDDLAAVRKFFASPPFNGVPAGITVAHDPEHSVTQAYYCTARGFCPDIKFPETYIVDGNGRLVAYVVGPRDWSHPAARAFLESLLGS